MDQPTPNQPTPPIRYCLYARKSTESDEQQALSIDSQIKEMTRIAIRDNLKVTDIRRESHSAKSSGQRPIYNQLVEDIRQSKFDGILTWAPDRLSRNAGDLGVLVDMMDQKILREIRTYSQVFNNDPNQKFLLMILGSQAKLENDNRSLNVKRGMKTRVEMGLWPWQPPTGYLPSGEKEQKCVAVVDPERAPIIKQIFQRVAYDGWSGRKVFMWLKDGVKFRTKNGKFLHLANVQRILQNQFYYGIIEYPTKSGTFYTGKHEPLIDKTLFDLVQTKIKKDIVINYASKEFAFTKLIICGHCGSGITADEKFKKLSDGTTNRYVYYGCTRSRDINCPGGYIREEALMDQIVNLVEKANLDQLGITAQFEQEIDRYRRFQTAVLGQDEKSKMKPKEKDMRAYAKYILKHGEVSEKRALLINLKSKLVLRNKKIELGVNTPNSR